MFSGHNRLRSVVVASWARVVGTRPSVDCPADSDSDCRRFPSSLRCQALFEGSALTVFRASAQIFEGEAIPYCSAMRYKINGQPLKGRQKCNLSDHFFVNFVSPPTTLGVNDGREEESRPRQTA
jgi:hypothetical protein